MALPLARVQRGLDVERIHRPDIATTFQGASCHENSLWLSPAGSRGTSRCLLRGATDQNLDASQTERLVKLCKVWGTVRYLHPYLAYKDVDWDAALVEALPKVEAAKDEEQYRAAVQTMLDRLGDRATRVVCKISQTQEEQPKVPGKEKEDRPLFNWVEDGVLALHMDTSLSLDNLTDPKT